MDEIHGQPLGDWLPRSSGKSFRLDSSAELRHLDAGRLAAPTAAWPISEGVLESLRRSEARTRNAAWGYAYGRPDHLIELVRRAACERPSFLAPVHVIERTLSDVLDGEISDDTRRAVIATLAQKLPETLDRTLPRSTLELYPEAVTLLADFLESSAVYDEDFFAKDLRFVCGATAPGGAQILDVLFPLSPAARLLRLRRTLGTVGRLVLAGDPRRAAGLLAQGGTGDWLQIHTDIRNIADFNAQGWDRCYHRISDILTARPRIAGMLGISWFYDPQLREISPRLSYLQDKPLQNGAFLVRLKPGPIHSQRAAATSPTRRRLIESGAYTPVCYALFWPRRELLRWAGRIEMDVPERSIFKLSDAA
jgi:hypothetical protein